MAVPELLLIALPPCRTALSLQWQTHPQRAPRRGSTHCLEYVDQGCTLPKPVPSCLAKVLLPYPNPARPGRAPTRDRSAPVTVRPRWRHRLIPPPSSPPLVALPSCPCPPWPFWQPALAAAAHQPSSPASPPPPPAPPSPATRQSVCLQRRWAGCIYTKASGSSNGWRVREMMRRGMDHCEAAAAAGAVLAGAWGLRLDCPQCTAAQQGHGRLPLSARLTHLFLAFGVLHLDPPDDYVLLDADACSRRMGPHGRSGWCRALVEPGKLPQQGTSRVDLGLRALQIALPNRPNSSAGPPTAHTQSVSPLAAPPVAEPTHPSS